MIYNVSCEFSGPGVLVHLSHSRNTQRYINRPYKINNKNDDDADKNI